MNIVFMGTPDFAVPALKALLASNHNIIALYTQTPRKSGRGHKLTCSSTHNIAITYDIPVETPLKLDEDSIKTLHSYNPDIIIVAAYGMLLPKAVLKLAPCINIHPSSLPRWRGADPIRHTVLSGDKTTAVCIMEMEEGLDTGAIYLQEKTKVGENETCGELHDRLAKNGAKLLLEVVNKWDKYKNNKTPQVGETIYAHKTKQADLKSIRPIDFNKPANEVQAHIMGLSPWPGATFTYNNEEIKVLNSEIAKISGNPNEVLFADKINGLVVACKSNALKITKVQKAGKKPVDITDFINGFKLEVGTKLNCAE